MTASDADPTVSTAGLGPIFGDEPDENEDELVPFQLAVLDSRSRRTLHPLTARRGMDASSVFGFMSPKVSTGRRVKAMQDFLTRSLVDDDGISVHEVPRAVVKRGSGDDAEWVDVASLEATPAGEDIRWVVGDNTDWDTEEAAEEHARDHGSSLRRWAAIMDDGSLRIRQSALQGVIGHIVSEGGDRPTQPSKRSSGSRKTPARSGRS